MAKLFTLPGNIALTSDMVNAIRDGYERVAGIPDPVGSIEFVTPVDRTKPGYWALSWFSKQYAPDEVVFRIQDMEIALSTDAQNRLRGKLVDIVNGVITVLDNPAPASK